MRRKLPRRSPARAVPVAAPAPDVVGWSRVLFLAALISLFGVSLASSLR